MESIKDRSTLNWTTDDRRRTTRRGGVMMALLLAVGLFSVSAFAQTNGTMQTRLNTLPRGAVFLADQSAAGGHWWVSDQANGICELTPSGGQPPFALTSCNGNVKSGGQITVGTPAASLGLAAGSKFLYVADHATTSTVVVRFVFSPSGNGSLGASTKINVPNVTSVGGGAGGGRSVAVALTDHNGPAANGGAKDLYVGFIKSGDIMRIDGIDAVAMTNLNPPVAKVASTSDGKGINQLLFFGLDLYVAEIGGGGMSVINDPSGLTRAACTALSNCAAVPLGSIPSALPGGLATDWVSGTPTTGKFIYVGDSQRAVQNSVKRYDPATGIATVYSLNISPSYTSPDGNGVLTTWTTYILPGAIGYNNGELLVGDDSQFLAATPALQQGHFWKVPRPALVRTPVVTSVAPISGTSLGGTRITVSGNDLATYDNVTGAVTILPSIAFGANAGTAVACANAVAPPPNPTPGTCTVTSPAGSGVVDVRVTVSGQTSAIAQPADQYQYIPPPTNAITVTSVAPARGVTGGGTLVTITGANLAAYDIAGNVTSLPSIAFGANGASNVACQPTAAPVVLPVSSICTAISPAGAAGVVEVQATRIPAGTSPLNPPADQFTYVAPVASLYSWGVTAPKGGATWLPGALGGHFWSSDHAQGFCRQDLDSTAGAFTVAGNTLHAMNLAACGDDLVGSAGQGVYDPSLVPGTTFHYVYVPDNAVKSTAVWRLTFDPSTESMVPDPIGGAMATAMIPLADVRTLKPNGMALGPDGNLYVSDLTDPFIRVVTNPAGDPRSQTISLVATTGDGRGANGTAGFVGNLLYISGNRATQFFDITKCPLVGGGVCGMASVPAPVGVFIAGTATDAANKFVYLSNSAGGGPASIYRYNASTDVYVAFAPGTYAADAFGIVHCTACTTGATAAPFINNGLLPPIGSPNGTVTIALTGLRPWDQTSHPTAGVPAGSFVPTAFAFAFGITTNPAGDLILTEDPTAGARAGRGSMWIVPFIP